MCYEIVMATYSILVDTFSYAHHLVEDLVNSDPATLAACRLCMDVSNGTLTYS